MRTFRATKSGFTLVELLVVITIIGVLVSLLLPAVQAARESARQVQCQNQIKQLALGMLNHEQAHGFFPTGGWPWYYAGDPDRGFDKKQPGGWLYNILGFIELQSLRDRGAGLDDASKRIAAGVVRGTPVPMFICPTRRRPVTFAPVWSTDTARNADNPSYFGRSDYAANAGSYPASPDCPNSGPTSLSQGDTTYDWNACDAVVNCNGICYTRSQVKVANIIDGTTNTYLCGEKSLSIDHYYVNSEHDWYNPVTWGSQGDDQSWDQGYDYDNNRWTEMEPWRDMPGFSNDLIFGSAHANGFGMAFCDGSARMMNYRVDATIHFRLGDRQDKQVIPGNKW